MDTMNVMLEPLRVILTEAGLFLPRLAVALVVVAGGWVLAKVARFATVRFLRAINFPVVTGRAGLDGFLHQGGVPWDTTHIFGFVAYAVVLLAALIVAFNGLGLNHVTELLSRLMLFVPRLVLALVILVFGAYFARVLGNAVTAYCRASRFQDAGPLGDLTRYAVLTFVALIALDQMQIGGDIIRESFLIILAGVVLALALAFGLGGRRWAAGVLERWWPRRPDGDRH